VPGFEIAIAIAIEKPIRINHDPILIAELDPGSSGKNRSMEVFL
jgi:hypothetical protein